MGLTFTELSRYFDDGMKTLVIKRRNLHIRPDGAACSYDKSVAGWRAIAVDFSAEFPDDRPTHAGEVRPTHAFLASNGSPDYGIRPGSIYFDLVTITKGTKLTILKMDRSKKRTCRNVVDVVDENGRYFWIFDRDLKWVSLL